MLPSIVYDDILTTSKVLLVSYSAIHFVISLSGPRIYVIRYLVNFQQTYLFTLVPPIQCLGMKYCWWFGRKKKSFACSLFFCPIKSVSAGQMCKEDDGVNGVFIICAYMYTQTHRHHHHRNHHHHHHHHHNDCDDKQTSTRKRPLTLGYFSFLKCLKLNANEGFVCRGNLHKCTDNHPSSSAKTLGASQGPIMGFAFAEGTSVGDSLKT